MSEIFDDYSKTWDQENFRHRRAEIIAQAIKKSARLEPGFKGLDYGCGTGLLGFHFTEQAGSFTFADTSKGMIDAVENKIERSKYSHCSTFLIDGKIKQDHNYHIIMNLLVLHHIEDYQSALSDLYDMLSPGGYLCIADLVKEDGTFHENEKVPHWGFSQSELESHFKSLGFKNVESTIPYVEEKERLGVKKKYPLFLIIGEK